MILDAFFQILQIFAVIFFGFILKIFKVADEKDGTALTRIVTYTALPALVFTVIYKSSFKPGVFTVPVIGLSVMFILTGLSLFLSRFMCRNEPWVVAPFILASSGGNTGFLGYPLVSKIYGNEGLGIAIVYDIFATVIYTMTLGIILSSYFSKKRTSWVDIPKLVFSFVPLQAAILAILLKPFEMPEPVMDVLDFLAKAAIPLILLAIGISVQPIVEKYHFHLGITVTLLKMVISPVIAFLLGSIFLRGLELKVTVVEAAMPSMMMSYVLAERYELDSRFASFVVLMTTMLCMITGPVVISIIK